MDTLQIALTPEHLVLVPIVAAIVQILKRVEFVQKITSWLPFVSIGVALLLGYVTKMPDPIVPSIIIGLMASGGYDLVKSPTK